METEPIYYTKAKDWLKPYGYKPCGYGRNSIQFSKEDSRIDVCCLQSGSPEFIGAFVLIDKDTNEKRFFGIQDSGDLIKLLEKFEKELGVDNHTEVKMPLREKPPLGLIPKHIHEELTKRERFEEVCEAMERYFRYAKQIPVDWFNEYNELSQYLSDFTKKE